MQPTIHTLLLCRKFGVSSLTNRKTALGKVPLEVVRLFVGYLLAHQRNIQAPELAEARLCGNDFNCDFFDHLTFDQEQKFTAHLADRIRTASTSRLSEYLQVLPEPWIAIQPGYQFTASKWMLPKWFGVFGKDGVTSSDKYTRELRRVVNRAHGTRRRRWLKCFKGDKAGSFGSWLRNNHGLSIERTTRNALFGASEFDTLTNNGDSKDWRLLDQVFLRYTVQNYGYLSRDRSVVYDKPQILKLIEPSRLIFTDEIRETFCRILTTLDLRVRVEQATMLIGGSRDAGRIEVRSCLDPGALDNHYL